MTSTLVMLCLSAMGAPHALAQSTAPENAIQALQYRLKEAGCYRGPVDGKDSEDLKKAQKACPNQAPQLRIETGMHSAAIRSIAVDRQCRSAVTGSDDKTLRLWSLPDGKLQRTIRLPIGEGDEGKIDAVSMSGDGGLVAAGGWTTHDRELEAIHLVPTDGQPPRRIGGLPNVALNLAFSPDGKHVAAVLGSGGLRVFDVASSQEVFADSDYGDLTLGLAYAADGSIYTASFDGFLRLYDRDHRLKAKVKTRAQKPFSVALSPDGKRLAVGYKDLPRIDLYAAPELKFLKSVDVAGVDNGDHTKLIWTSDGFLHAGGWYQIDGKNLILSWTREGARSGKGAEVAQDTIMSLNACGSDVIFAAADPVWGRLDGNGSASILGESAAADMRGKTEHNFLISADARQVYFGLGYGAETPVLFDLGRASLSDAPKPPEKFLPPKTDGLPIVNWEGDFAPKFRGKKLELLDYEFSRSLAAAHDGGRFFLGTEFGLRAYDAEGSPQGDKKPTTGVVWGVNLSRDDKLLVAAISDGTIRWYSAADRRELLALFVDKRDRRWVAWTPSGYYMASVGGEDLIGWHVNRGWDQEAQFYPASQLRDKYFRPDIVQAILTTRDEGKAIAAAEAERLKKLERERLAPEPAPKPQSAPPTAQPLTVAELPPQAIIVSPKDGAHFSGETIDVEYRLQSPGGRIVDVLTAEVDGRKIGAQNQLPNGARGSFTILLPKHDVVVSLKPVAAGIAPATSKINLRYDGAPPPDTGNPRLYVLAIGIDQYQNEDEFPRTYANYDIDGIVNAMNSLKKARFSDVIVHSMLDEQVTRTTVAEAFDDIYAKSQDNDFVIVYLIGHGFLAGAKNEYHFMLKKGSKGFLNSTSLDERDLIEPLSNLSGTKILMIESCHSGAVDANNTDGQKITGMINRIGGTSPRLFVMGAAEGYQLAHFDAKWNYRGAFTQAVIEGLGENKASDGTGRVTMLSLYRYIEKRVERLAAEHGQSQHPIMMPQPKDFSDFDITRTK